MKDLYLVYDESYVPPHLKLIKEIVIQSNPIKSRRKSLSQRVRSNIFNTTSGRKCILDSTPIDSDNFVLPEPKYTA